jgi:hypothetical protein
VWDIIGDHTGAVSPTLGNPAADTVNNANGGYMLVVNASYRIDSAFQQTITGLCPNTYYEISCWVRNICSKCGCDSNGKGATNTTTTPAPYIPTQAGPPGSADSSGVYPNLTFEVNGLDYYTTGNIRYTGTWVKKGFTYRTGPAQTSIVLKFFNNAPGGGGNDWALDDISVATCLPNLTVNPTPFYTACENNLVDFGATVRSFFSNYNQYKWQRSTDGGSTWNDLGISGTATPVLVGGQYEYTASFPGFIATRSDSGHRYRIVVGTTIPNLSDPNCATSGGSDFTTLNIIECTILPARLRKFTGTIARDEARLQWATENEDGPLEFLIERSSDGIHFQPSGTMAGRYQLGASHIYRFTDPQPVSGETFYRLTLVPEGGASVRSQVIRLQPPSGDFRVKVVQNPFRDRWRLNIDIPVKGRLQLQLSDITGKRVSVRDISAEGGMLSIEEPALHLSAGVYLLQVRYGIETRHIQLVKTN